MGRWKAVLHTAGELDKEEDLVANISSSQGHEISDPYKGAKIEKRRAEVARNYMFHCNTETWVATAGHVFGATALQRVRNTCLTEFEKVAVCSPGLEV